MDHYYSVSRTGLKGAGNKAQGEKIEGWKEWMLEHVLILGLDADGHKVLGAHDSMPLLLDGGTTAFAPDQLYIDRTGRLTLVELKRVTAGPKELAQLLAYGEHYRPLPWSQLEEAFAFTRHAKRPTDRRAEAEGTVRMLAMGRLPEKEPNKGNRVPYLDLPAPRLRDAAKDRWKDRPTFAMPAAPPRLILAAPDFDRSVRNATDEMRQRGVDIRLAQCDLLHARGQLVLRWDWVKLDEPAQRGKSAPLHGPTYRWFDMLCEAMACLVEEKELSKRLELSGWAENMQTLLVSASLREHWPVRLYLEAEEGKSREKDTLTLWTCLPHAWCMKKRDEWKKELHDALDATGAKDGDSGARYWAFRWPSERQEFVDKALEVANTLSDILGRPAAAPRGER